MIVTAPRRPSQTTLPDAVATTTSLPSGTTTDTAPDPPPTTMPLGPRVTEPPCADTSDTAAARTETLALRATTVTLSVTGRGYGRALLHRVCRDSYCPRITSRHVPDMVSPTTAPTLEPTDAGPGRARTARSERTRTSVVDALLDLLREGNLRPTAKEIAERAGTSLRSVYVHFDDLEDLFTAAATRAIGRIAGLMETIAPTGPLDARLDAFVAQRARVFEGLGEVRHAAALQEPFSPGLATLLARGRRRARQEVESVFEPEIAALPDGERAAATDACDALASAATWDHWRHLQGGDVDAACAALRLGLRRILLARA